MKRRYPPIGSFSEGTLRPDDLTPTNLDLLLAYGDASIRKEARGLRREFDALPSQDDCNDEELEALLEIHQQSEGLLNEICGPYMHCGAADGDGACFGFWPSLESLEEDRQAGEVIKVNDLSEARAPRWNGPGFLMVVNDHGNVTLYERRGSKRFKWAEVWSCV